MIGTPFDRLHGIRLIADERMVEFAGLDWSGCRSRARAERRRRRGFPQRVRPIVRPKPDVIVYQPRGVPKAFIAHPDVLAQLGRELPTLQRRAP